MSLQNFFISEKNKKLWKWEFFILATDVTLPFMISYVKYMQFVWTYIVCKHIHICFYLSLSTFIINCMAYEYLWMYIHGTGGVTAEKKYHKFNVLFVGKGWFDVVHISKKTIWFIENGWKCTWNCWKDQTFFNICDFLFYFYVSPISFNSF